MNIETANNLENLNSSIFSGNLLVVDDDDSIRFLLIKKLEKLGFKIYGANSLKEAAKLIESVPFNAVILDQYLKDGLGTELVNNIMTTSPYTKIVFLTAHESVELATETLLNGASGFLLKSETVDKNIENFVKIIKPSRVSSEINNVKTSEVIGRSTPIQNVLNKLSRIAQTDSTVLLTGESGVGKELFAKTLHQMSHRKDAQFIAINCAAISEQLLEAELFGSKKGAYTDARSDRKGYFESCNDGTLLLDEIGEMSPSMQAKLLRVLQEKEVTPVGSCVPVKINTRVIAATNRVLWDEVKKGNFREDLYYRLAVINIHIPPLKERIEDIPLLVSYFLKKFNKKFNKQVQEPSNEIYAKLKAYSWPGNVRELYNSIERAMLLADKNQMYIEDLIPPRALNEGGLYSGGPDSKEAIPLDYKEAKDKFEKRYIENLLKVTNYKITDAAKVSNQYRTNIYRLIEKHNIKIKKES